ncbi:avidin/streptavidin family protein [Pseudomonas cedrina]|uniref:avidin/streptavidin family protein n=1 Tax=Pseudomonas cedrina TaxID=651740 RepID=UPI003EDA80C1
MMTMAGIWTNDYGSVMTLEVSGRQVIGTYRSSTGSTGEYLIAGCVSGKATTRVESQAVALAIGWRNLGDEKKDPSWNWASGLSGQLTVTDEGDVLTLNHLLVATSDFPELARPGTYIDKLVYKRAEQQTPTRTRADIDPVPTGNTLTGRWVTADGASLMLSVHSDSMKRFGIVQGCFRSQETSAEVIGFTDINAQESKLSLQSVSLTIALSGTDTVCTACGTLDLATGTLSLLVLTSSVVAPAHTYLATQISTQHFSRTPDVFNCDRSLN